MRPAAQRTGDGEGTRLKQHVERSHAASAPKTLAELGISHTQSSRWQKLADVPEGEFEATFAKPEKPSTSAIITANAPKKENAVEEEAIDCNLLHQLWNAARGIGDIDSTPDIDAIKRLIECGYLQDVIRAAESFAKAAALAERLRAVIATKAEPSSDVGTE
jgi:hypothetical protein